MPKRPHPRSAEAEAYRVLYRSKQWEATRIAVLTRDLFTCQRPQCGCILLTGRPQHPRAAIVHHVIPHKGDRALFFDKANLVSVCKSCHDKPIQADEANGFVVGHDQSGRPVDQAHPWNATRTSAARAGGQLTR